MSKISLQRSNLKGEIKISGSKNAVLPILAASILINDKIRLKNIPHIGDVGLKMSMMGSLNSNITFFEDYIEYDNFELKNAPISANLSSRLRTSILFLSSLLSRFGYAKIGLPGGCPIGNRPIDIHIELLEAMGAKIEITNNYIEASLNGKFIGNTLKVRKKSVGATQNAVTAAVMADGITVIQNAAQEPEVSALCEFLNIAGAKIEGIGTDILRIKGVTKLHGLDFFIPEDRIEAGTYACIGALPNQNIVLSNCNIRVFDGVLEIFRNIGIGLEKIDNNKTTIKRLDEYENKFNIKTGTFPEFPTDLQAQITAYLLSRQGHFEIEEDVFENRLMHVHELNKMGAGIQIKGSTAIINNQSSSKELIGSVVSATDLRASASLIIAGLMAKGETVVENIHHLDRGYEAIDSKIMRCGGIINRIP